MVSKTTGVNIGLFLCFLPVFLFSATQAGAKSAQGNWKGRCFESGLLKLYVNGKETETSTTLVLKENRAFIVADSNLKKYAHIETFIIDVALKGSVKVKIKNRGREIIFTENKSVMRLNDKTIEMPVAPFTHRGKLMLPVRILFENTGYSINWSKDKKIYAVDKLPIAAKYKNSFKSTEEPNLTTASREIKENPAIIPQRLPKGYLDSVFKNNAPVKEEVSTISQEAMAATSSITRETGVIENASNQVSIDTSLTKQMPEQPVVNTELQNPTSAKAKPKEEGSSIEYTYDNIVSFSNVAISGDTEQSNYIPNTALSNGFNITLKKQMINGYQAKGIIRTTSTNDPMYNQGQLDKFTLSLDKTGSSLNAYDITPKFTNYALKNYQLRGMSHTRSSDGYSYTAILGKSPKKLYDSEYARYARGLRFEKSKKKGRIAGFSYVDIKDTGSPLQSERFRNKVYILDYANRFGKSTRMEFECARSENKIGEQSNETGNAVLLKADYRNRISNLSFKFEHIGTFFNSETTFFTAGKREVSLGYTKKVNPRINYTTGFKKMLLGGEETSSLPIYITMQPLDKRQKLKLSLRRNFEKSRFGGDVRFTDLRQFGYSDVIGSVKISATYERKQQKEADGSIDFRVARKSNFELPLTSKTILSFQTKEERRTTGSRPVTRFFKTGLEYQLDDWAGIFSNVTRYYNNTSNDRIGFSTGYRMMNPDTSAEISVAYSYLNYREHNDNVVTLSYSFLR
ncbi:MAG: copper amine oxidase N-terminal domain-containing protein [bacterium]